MTPEWPEAGSPQTVTFARVRQHVEQRPFSPFRIVTTSGRVYDVPSADHVGLLPITRMILVGYDSGESVDIPAVHVAAIEPLHRRTTSELLKQRSRLTGRARPPGGPPLHASIPCPRHPS